MRSFLFSVPTQMCILSKSSIFRVKFFYSRHWNHKTTQYKAQSLLCFLFYWFPFFFQYQKIPISELCLSSLKLSISLKIGLQPWIYKCTYSIYRITLSVLVIHAAGGVKSCVIMWTLSRERKKMFIEAKCAVALRYLLVLEIGMLQWQLGGAGTWTPPLQISNLQP